MRKRRKFLFISWLIQLLININLLFKNVDCKGIGMVSASAGGGLGVCLDCSGNYTEEELDVSLIVLSLILSVFFLILCSQCISRFRARFSNDDKCKRMPPPPYIRRNYSFTV